MHMDEDFISAVLSSPTDSEIRREYANSLRKSDAARADYLEMERKWAQTRQPSDYEKLQDLAVGLDSVWVARISRPPAGVCCSHLRTDCDTENAPPPVSIEDLGWIESRFQLVLPAEYRAFLLNYNGALRPSCHLEITPEQRSLGCNEYVFFCSILEARDAEIDDGANLVWRLQSLDDEVRRVGTNLHDLPYQWQQQMARRWRSEPYANWMIIGTGTPTGEMEWFCLECRGRNPGRVYCVDPESLLDPDHCLIAPRFAAFLGMIFEQVHG